MTEPARKGRKPIWYIVGCIGLLAMPCIGTLAATVFRAFDEVTANLAAIKAGVERYCETEHSGRRGSLPRAAGPTLVAPGRDRQTPTLGPEWEDVSFHASGPSYYAYSIERPDAHTAIVVAESDLDGDGARSRYASTCTSDGTSQGCSCGQLEIARERE